MVKFVPFIKESRDEKEREEKIEGLIKKLKERNHTSEATRQDFANSLHRFCRDVDYYIDKGMSEKDAVGYVKFFYRSKK